MAPYAGSLGVGPYEFDVSWWNGDEGSLRREGVTTTMSTSSIRTVVSEWKLKVKLGLRYGKELTTTMRGTCSAT